MPLTLRPAHEFVGSNDPVVDGDFDVFDGSRRVGRVYFLRSGREPWRWRLSANLLEQPLTSRAKVAEPPSGRAETRAKALESLGRAYHLLRSKALPGESDD